MTIHATTPDLSGAHPVGEPVPLEAFEELTRIEAARTRQLSSLPENELDPVGIAYRDSIMRILQEVRAARRRLLDGLYGVCASCDGEIASERLEARPWATTCATCVRRS